jgi:PhnB protein
MKSFTTYLNFDGNARDAVTFYQKCFGIELEIQTFKDAKMDTPKGAENRVMHARLVKNGNAVLMASDTPPGAQYRPGNNFSIAVDCDSIQEEEKLFAALGEGGKVTMPLQDTFWGARFGMLTDRFGVNWMLNAEQPKKTT